MLSEARQGTSQGPKGPTTTSSSSSSSETLTVDLSSLVASTTSPTPSSTASTVPNGGARKGEVGYFWCAGWGWRPSYSK